MATPTPTLEQLAEACNQLHTQFTISTQQISSLQNDLGQTRTNLDMTQTAVHKAQNQLASSSQAPERKAPQPFKGKDSVTSWTTHMNNYLANAPEQQNLLIAISYLDGHAAAQVGR